MKLSCEKGLFFWYKDVLKLRKLVLWSTKIMAILSSKRVTTVMFIKGIFFSHIYQI